MFRQMMELLQGKVVMAGWNCSTARRMEPILSSHGRRSKGSKQIRRISAMLLGKSQDKLGVGVIQLSKFKFLI